MGTRRRTARRGARGVPRSIPTVRGRGHGLRGRLGRRLLAFDLDGAALGTWRWPIEALWAGVGSELARTEGAFLHGPLSDGSFLVRAGTYLPTDTLGRARESVRFATWGPRDGQVREVGWVGGAEVRVRRGRTGPLGRRPHLTGPLLATTDGRFLVAYDGMGFGLAAYDVTGRLRRVSRVRRPLAAVDDRLRERWRENRSQWWGATLEGIPPGRLQRLFEETPFPDSASAFERLRVDRLGATWALEHPVRDWAALPAVYHVFSPAGVYLGEVELPDGFRMMDADADEVIGVYRGAYGVQSIRSYGLVGRAAPGAAGSPPPG